MPFWLICKACDTNVLDFSFVLAGDFISLIVTVSWSWIYSVRTAGADKVDIYGAAARYNLFCIFVFSYFYIFSFSSGWNLKDKVDMKQLLETTISIFLYIFPFIRAKDDHFVQDAEYTESFFKSKGDKW